MQRERADNPEVHMMRNAWTRSSWMRCVVTIVFMVLAMSSPQRAYADGRAYTRLVASPAEMPDQEAIVAYRDGVETLVIETRVRTNADELAWVVPVPAAPEISATTSGVFPTLRAMTAPRIIRSPWLPATGILIPLAILLALGLFVPKWTMARLAAYIALGACLLVLLMPALGTARSIAGSPTAVEVVTRSVVGSYETEVVRSEDPQALERWLSERGFVGDDATHDAVAEYVKAGWVFVVSRLRHDPASGAILTPHPLVLRFPASVPVYPMRLTLPQSEDFRLSLYVFGEGPMGGGGMTVEVSAPLRYEPEELSLEPRLMRFVGTNEMVVAHDALDALVRPAPHMTKLSRTWKKGSGAEDITLAKFDDGGSSRIPIAWDDKDAVAASIAAWLGMANAGLVVALLARSKGRSFSFKVAGWTSGLAIPASLVLYATIPKVATVSYYQATRHLGHLVSELESGISTAIRGGQRLDLAWLRAQSKVISERTYAEQTRGLSAAERALEPPILEEDSPGNYWFTVDPSKPGVAYMNTVTGQGVQYELTEFSLGEPDGPRAAAPTPEPAQGPR